MRLVRVHSKTITDNTGNTVDIPVLLVEKNGAIDVLWSLHRYLLKNRYKSVSWQDKLIQAVSLLLEYMEANYDCFRDPKDLFENFTDAVYAGTIGEDGSDPSRLFWLPKKRNTARPLLVALSEYSDWMHKEYANIPLNPWREATRYEERLNWAAQINRSNRSFLGHLSDPDKIADAAKKARNVVQRRIPVGNDGPKKAFPEDRIFDLLFEGFRRDNEENFIKRYNWRDIAITILLHGGGLRESEPFHLWVHDVMPDPNDPEKALVRIYHPIDGQAPKDFRMPNGKYLPNREAYLRMKYGLSPRNLYPKNDMRRAGWKHPKLSDKDQGYIYVHWFPSYWGYLFMQVWKMYMAERILEKVPDTHPYLFVSFKRKHHGDMYTIGSFRQSHARAVEKIGLKVGKYLGTTEHAHRHAYGQLGSIAGVDGKALSAGLHHVSEESKKVYTEPTIERITKELAKATQALENGQQLPMVVDIDAWFNQEKNLQKYWTQRRRK